MSKTHSKKPILDLPNEGVAWKKYKFGDVVKLSRERYNAADDSSNHRCIELEHMDSQTGRINGWVDSKEQKSTKTHFAAGDVLYGKLRPYLRKYHYAKFRGVCSTEIWVFRTSTDLLENKFLYYLVQTDRFNDVANASIGTHMPRADWSHVRSIKFSLPPVLEQRKISGILSTWDRAIELKEQLINQKQKQKKGLMQKLLTGEVRLPGFRGEWGEVRLGTLIEESTERSVKNDQHRILSVTKDGIVLQSEYFKRQVASSDNVGYKVIEKGDLAFSAMNLWMGSLDILTDHEVGIISPAYNAFKVDYSKVDQDFFKDYIKTSRMLNLYNINSEQGASVVRRNLDLRGLLASKVSIPTFKEQRAIGKVLACINREISLQKEGLKLLKLQKKGLMQLLLTGTVRVKEVAV